MRKQVTIRKPRQRQRPVRRRSQTRLGSKSTRLETSLPKATLSLKPALSFWKVNSSRIVGLLGLTLIIWILYLLFSLDDFYIYQAEVVGNRILQPQEIYAAGGVNSQSIFWINPAEVTARIEALPNVKTARIYLTMPANLKIEVEERHPEVVWQTGDKVWWIDNEGTFVPPRQESAEPQMHLRIIDDDNRSIQANDQIDLSIIRGAQILNEHKPEIEVLHYSRQFGLSYTTVEGWPIYLGKSSNISGKLLIADAVRADLSARQVIPLFIDVRNPFRVIYQSPPEGTGL